MRYIYKKKDASAIEKHGVRMRIYNSKEDCPQAALVYQETESGHAEEFYHEKSAFIYYIIEGNGIWIIEDKQYDVSEGDVIIVPPGKRFYFKGKIKQICITAPAWEERYERHIRYLEGFE
jgi:mannose-6-phosphate isomerase-like protein (cupin superfamily)